MCLWPNDSPAFQFLTGQDYRGGEIEGALEMQREGRRRQAPLLTASAGPVPVPQTHGLSTLQEGGTNGPEASPGRPAADGRRTLPTPEDIAWICFNTATLWLPQEMCCWLGSLLPHLWAQNGNGQCQLPGRFRLPVPSL